MDIYPQDLGRVGYRRVVHLRTQSAGMNKNAAPKPKEPQAQTPLTGLHRAWIQGSGVPAETAYHAPTAFADCRRAIWLGSPGLVSTLLISIFGIWCFEALVSYSWDLPRLMDWLYPSWLVAGAAEIYYTAVARPRQWFRLLHAPLTEPNVKMLMSQEQDPLARDFLSVVDLLRPLPKPVEASTEKNLRRALSALGEAIEELPRSSPMTSQRDPVQMRLQAADILEAAHRESDTIVAASLERRAVSLSRRAETVASVAVLLRRNQSLREEVSEQIEALRTSISALSVGSLQGAHELADLAASIQRVAAEASAVAVTRAEVDTLLSRPVAGSEVEEPREVRLSL